MHDNTALGVRLHAGPDTATDDELTHTVHAMQVFAGAEGLCYVTTFFEWQTGTHAAFYEMVEELKRTEARYVVVPSFDHLSTHRLLLSYLVDRLELDADTMVLTSHDT